MTIKTDTHTYYLAKYALSSGIKAIDCKPPGSTGYCQQVGGYGLYKLGKDVFETESEAVANAEDHRVKKIASLKKQIEKLERMTFKVES